MPQPELLKFTIGGRVFVTGDPTFEQELYIMEQATAAGLAKAGGLSIDPATDQLPSIAQQMIVTAYKSGALFSLLGAMLTEEGTDWTPELAQENAAFFRTIRDRESKNALHTALAGSVVAFFESATSFATISDTSLVPDALSRDAERLVATPSPTGRRRPVLTPAQAEEVFRSGHMPSRSAKSRSTTKSTRG